MRRCGIFWFRSGIQTELLLDGREIGGVVGRGTPRFETWNLSEAAFSCPNLKKNMHFPRCFSIGEVHVHCKYQNDPKWWRWVEKEVKRRIIHDRRIIPCTKVSNPWPLSDDKLPWRPEASAFAGFCCAGHRRFWRDWLQWVLGSLVYTNTSVGILQKTMFANRFFSKNEIEWTKSISQNCCYNTRTHTHTLTGRYLDDDYLLLKNMEARAGPFTFPNHPQYDKMALACHVDPEDL